MLYQVDAKCGHVGRNNYIVKSFAVMAESAKDAAKKCRNFPRVKHDKKDAIKCVIEIDADAYIALLNKNNNDPYFRCTSVQEQNLLCDLNGEILKEESTEIFRKKAKNYAKKHKLERIRELDDYELEEYNC